MGFNGQNINNTGKAGFIDVETTGLSNTDEIIELAITLFQFDRKNGKILQILDEYVGLREPGVSIKPGARKVHGLTRRDLKGKRLNREQIKRLIKEADFLIAHNASFDRRFVIKMFPEARQKEWRCSMSDISWKAKGFQSRGLQNLLYDHNLTADQAHRALDDVHAALRLLATRNRSGNYNTYFQELLEQGTG
ncbi:MAG: exonuclease domain-containing protein [Bacillota bacterium]